jgi:hypothetical protein
MTVQQRYDEEKRILRDIAVSESYALEALRMLSRWRGSLSDFRVLLKQAERQCQ